MRQLNGTDLGRAFRLVQKAGVKDELVSFATAVKAKDGRTQEELGLELILGIISRCGDEDAEQALWEFLSGPLGKSPVELRDMDLLDLMTLIGDFIKSIDLEAWRSFFTSLANAMRRS